MLERIPPTRYDDLALPDVMLGLYDWVIAWDHRSRGLDRLARPAGMRGGGEKEAGGEEVEQYVPVK